MSSCPPFLPLLACSSSLMSWNAYCNGTHGLRCCHRPARSPQLALEGFCSVHCGTREKQECYVTGVPTDSVDGFHNNFHHRNGRAKYHVQSASSNALQLWNPSKQPPVGIPHQHAQLSIKCIFLPNMVWFILSISAGQVSYFFRIKFELLSFFIPFPSEAMRMRLYEPRDESNTHIVPAMSTGSCVVPVISNELYIVLVMSTG